MMKISLVLLIISSFLIKGNSFEIYIFYCILICSSTFNSGNVIVDASVKFKEIIKLMNLTDEQVRNLRKSGLSENQIIELAEKTLKPLSERGSKWECVSNRYMNCTSDLTKQSMCNDIKEDKLKLIIDIKEKTYQRCFIDEKNCSVPKISVNVENIKSSGFTKISFKNPKDGQIRIFNDGSVFTDIAPVGLDVFISTGSCKSI